MKRIFLVVTIVFLSFQINAQALSGFWGIPWKSTVEDAKVIIESKGYTPNFSSNTIVSYKNIKFADRYGNLALYFDSNRFYSCGFEITPKKNNTLEEFNSLKDDLKTKYGKPKLETEKYKYPYEKGDGHEETAIAGSYTDISCSWWFDESNAIILKINSKDYNVTISLAYYCGEIAKEITQKNTKTKIDDL